MIQPGKKWYESRTLWFNLASLLVLVASILTDATLVSDPAVLKYAAIAVAIGNVILRFFTSMPIDNTSAE